MSGRDAGIVLGLMVIAAIVAVVIWTARPTYDPGLDAEVVAVNNRGVGFMGMFNYDDAYDQFAQALAANPTDADVRVNLAIATLNRQEDGDEVEAMRMLDAILADHPDNLRAQYCRGVLLLNAGREQEAADAFGLVSDRDPADAYAMYQVAQGLYRAREYEQAIGKYQRTIELDPYLRSAYHGAAQALRRLGEDEHAEAYEDLFTRLDTNPQARTFKIYYTRMGPKAEALALDEKTPYAAATPTGNLFADGRPLLTNGDAVNWAAGATRAVSITAADIDGDLDIDLFIAGAIDDDSAPNAVALNDGDGAFTLELDHPLAAIRGVRAAMWGDYDNDGLTDVYLARDGQNTLMRRTESGWEDVTESTATGGAELLSVDGLFVDADHDGDLDIFVINADGPNELFNNNSNGSFRALGASQGISGDETQSLQVIAFDIDVDRDVDLLVRHANGTELLRNELLWAYERVDNAAGLSLRGPATFADLDADGQPEVIELRSDGVLLIHSADDAGHWSAGNTNAGEAAGHPHAQLAIADFNGDGKLEALHTHGSSFAVTGGESLNQTMYTTATTGVTGIAPVVLGAQGPSVVAALNGQQPMIWTPGPGRSGSLTLDFAGRTDAGQSMRTNMSGIGTDIAVRARSTWTARSTLPQTSGPGQSLQPLSIGVNGWPHLDFVQMTWSDGVFQSELHGVSPITDAPPRDFTAGRHERIIETQRQVSSCPVLFAWNGERFVFISDVLGVGGIGFALGGGAQGSGEYATPRPWERFLMPVGSMIEDDNRSFELRLGEPMEEACYLDFAELVVYDLPHGWNMTLDERMQVKGPAPTGEPVFYREWQLPVNVVNDRGEDVTDAVRTVDDVAAPVGKIDRRFLGRLERDHVMTLTFDHHAFTNAVLLIDGWVEYPYSQTMFAAWQAGAEYRAPTIEARAADGEWITLLEQFGYPAGMPRQMSVPLNGLPPAATQLRITTNQQIYFDRIALAQAEPRPDVTVHRLAVTQATIAACGYPKRTTNAQYRPQYDYDDRSTIGDNRALRGFHTDIGPCTPLVTAPDDAVAIFGPGEEIRLRFDAGHLPMPADTTLRRYVLNLRGWCKDMDLYTRTGGTIEPLPRAGAAGDAAAPRDHLHRTLNTRYESGR